MRDAPEGYRVPFEELPASRRLLLLACRVEEEQLEAVASNATEPQLLALLDEAGRNVCGWRWVDGVVGAVIWRKQDGDQPDNFELRNAYVAATRWA